MDNLKFRVYVKSYKMMAYDVTSINFEAKTVECHLVTSEEGDPSEFEFDEVEIMQWTGKKDKKGEDIYDGDVVRVKSSDGFYDRIYYIKWNSEATEWSLYSKYDEPRLPLGTCIKRCKIIGNLHESPNLLSELSK